MAGTPPTLAIIGHNFRINVGTQKIIITYQVQKCKIYSQQNAGFSICMFNYCNKMVAFPYLCPSSSKKDTCQVLSNILL